MKKRFFPIAAALFGVLALAQISSAASISFTTTLLDSSNHAITSLSLGNGISVQYTPADPTTTTFDTGTDPSPIAVDYGTFAVSLSGNPVNVSVSKQYTIQLSISSPSVAGIPATPTIVGDITGTFQTVKIAGKNGAVDTLKFAFTPSDDTIGPLDYDIPGGINTVEWTFDGSNIGSSGVHPTYAGDMLGTVIYDLNTAGGPIQQSVPLPASVLTGSALLGAIFVARTRARKNAA